MISVSTTSGFKTEIDERALTDWRLTQALVKSQKGTDIEKLEGANDLATLLLGPDKFAELCEHIAKNNDGFVPAGKVMTELGELLGSAKQTKN